MWNATKIFGLAEQGGFNTITINWKDSKVERPARVFLLLNLSLTWLSRKCPPGRHNTLNIKNIKKKQKNKKHLGTVFFFLVLHPTVASGASWQKKSVKMSVAVDFKVDRKIYYHAVLKVCLFLQVHLLLPLSLSLTVPSLSLCLGSAWIKNILTHKSSFTGLLSVHYIFWTEKHYL